MKAVRMPRAKRSQATLPKVKRLNNKRSRDLFEVTVEGNFDVGDFFITITFPDGMSDEQREKEFRNFLRRLDYFYRKHGKTLLFIYVDERGDELGHLHYHLVINSIPEVSKKVIEQILFKSKAMQAGEYPDVRKIVRDEKSGLLALILYLGKQFERGAPNKRRWSCSRSIKRPVEIIEEDTVSLKELSAFIQAKRDDSVDLLAERVFKGWRLCHSCFATTDYITTDVITGMPHIELRMTQNQTIPHPTCDKGNWDEGIPIPIAVRYRKSNGCVVNCIL